MSQVRVTGRCGDGKKRGIIRRFLTYFNKRLAEAEALTDKAEAHGNVQHLSTRLEALASKFKGIHYELVSLIPDEDTETMGAEQNTLDEHNAKLDGYLVHLQRLLDATKPAAIESDKRSPLRNKLLYLDEAVQTIADTFGSLSPEADDLALIQQCQEELLDLKIEMKSCLESLTRLGVGDEDELRRQYLRLKTKHFDCSRMVKSKLSTTNGTSRTTSPVPPDHKTGLKVPKLDAPTFDGDILSWTLSGNSSPYRSTAERISLTPRNLCIYNNH